LVGDTEIVLVDGSIGPVFTVIVGSVVVSAEPLTVASILTGVPDVEAVNVAEYVPFSLSVTGPMNPLLVPVSVSTLNVTASPPVVTSLPEASIAWSVIMSGSPAVTAVCATESVDSEGDAVLGTTSIVGNSVVIGEPLTVAPIVIGVPTVVAVNVPV
jgi:hypothetical protein